MHNSALSWQQATHGVFRCSSSPLPSGILRVCSCARVDVVSSHSQTRHELERVS